MAEEIEQQLKRSDRVALAITAAMATWTFIFAFLMACLIEIWFNHSHLIPHRFQFDPTTIILNLFLSLIAAVQESVIMIAQNQADKARGVLFARMARMEEQNKELSEQNNRLELRLIDMEKANSAKLDYLIEKAEEAV